MRPVTNLQLFNVALSTVLLVGLAILVAPFDEPVKQLVVIVAIYGLFIAALSVFQGMFRNKQSIWFQPVSTRVSAILINSVVSVWLCVVGLFIFMVLNVRGESPRVVVTVIVALVAAGLLGRHLQKRFSSKSLLPYGISFLGALIMIVVAFATAT